MAYTRFDHSLIFVGIVDVVALVVLLFFLPDTAMVDGLVTVCICTLMLCARSYFARELKNPDDKLLELEKTVDSSPSALEAAQGGDWETVKSFLQDGSFKEAEKLMEQVIAVNEEPVADALCFDEIINRCSCEGDADRAAYWLQKMFEQGVVPDIGSFFPVISMLARKGDVDGAFRWLDLMRMAHVQPDIQCYKTLLCACSSIDNMTRAQQLFDEMHDEEEWDDGTSSDKPNVLPSLVAACYNAAVQAWAEAGYPRRAEYWMRRAIGGGCQIYSPSYHSIAAAFMEAGLEVEAKRWCRLNEVASRVMRSRTAKSMKR